MNPSRAADLPGSPSRPPLARGDGGGQPAPGGSRGAATTGAEVRRSLSRNFLATAVGRMVYLASRVALPPFILSYVSLEEYGIWACCFILISYLGMSAFGISNVYIRYVAEYQARGDVPRINRLVSTGLLVSSLLGALILVGLWVALPWIIRAFKISPALADTAFILLFATSATFVLDLSIGSFAQVLIGLQRIGAQTTVWVASSVLEAALIVVLLAAGLGVYALVIAFAVRFLVAIVAYVVLCRQELPGLSVGVRHFDRGMLRLFYGFGGIVQIAGLLGIFLYSIEKLIAGVFIGASATALFDVGEKFPVMVSGIPSSMNAALLPALSHLHTLEGQDEARSLYVQASRYISLIGGVLMAYLAVCAEAVIVFWLGPAEQFRAATFILAVFCVAFQMHVVTGPASALYRGIGKPARELAYPLTQLALVSLLVGGGFALVGTTIEVIAIGVAGAMVVSTGLYEAYTNRFLSVGQAHFFWRVWAPGLVPYVLGAVIAVVVRPAVAPVLATRWQAFGVLLAVGVVYAIVTPLVLYRFLCDANERTLVRQRLARVAGRVLPNRRQTAGGGTHR